MEPRKIWGNSFSQSKTLIRTEVEQSRVVPVVGLPIQGEKSPVDSRPVGQADEPAFRLDAAVIADPEENDAIDRPLKSVRMLKGSLADQAYRRRGIFAKIGFLLEYRGGLSWKLMANCHQFLENTPPVFSGRFMVGPAFARFSFLPTWNCTWRCSIGMVERLFSSRTLYRTLALFFRYPEEPLNPRLISRHTGTDMKCVHRELKKLEEIGIVRGFPAGKYRYYTLDSGHPVHEELRSMFAKTRQEWE